MEIRDQVSDDSNKVYRLIETAFGGEAETDLVDALRDNGDAVISLVAVDRDRIIGQILFSRLLEPERSLALAPVSVLPGHQKGGVGSALIRAGIERARTQGWGAIFVLGEPAYYERFGFSVAAAHKFETPYPKDYVMALELVPGFLGERAGPVMYPAPFQQFESQDGASKS